MNATPHAHAVDFRETRHRFEITYGDQSLYTERPFRFWWDSEEAYAKRCARRARMHINRVVRQHDRLSRVAGKLAAIRRMDLPNFRADQWGSEQL